MLGENELRCIHKQEKRDTERKKIEKLNFIKTKNFCFFKGHYQQTKKGPMEWQKAFVRDQIRD